MSGKTTVQWCPCCEAWKPSKAISRNCLTETAHGALPAGRFVILQLSHRCGSCQGEFVTFKVASRPSEHAWLANAELSRMRRQLSQARALAEERLAALRWDIHPELADFSLMPA
jgi:hypothetical protein